MFAWGPLGVPSDFGSIPGRKPKFESSLEIEALKIHGLKAQEPITKASTSFSPNVTKRHRRYSKSTSEATDYGEPNTAVRSIPRLKRSFSQLCSGIRVSAVAQWDSACWNGFCIVSEKRKRVGGVMKSWQKHRGRWRHAALRSAIVATMKPRSLAILSLLSMGSIVVLLTVNLRMQRREMAVMAQHRCRLEGHLCMSGVMGGETTGKICSSLQQLPLPWTVPASFARQSLQISDGTEPLVCVVVTTFNVEQYVGRALDSILHQTYGNMEILVVDDASTDSTGDRIERYALDDKRVRPIRLKQSTSGGAGQPTNIGMDSCSDEAEYVLIVDGDDWMERDALETVVDKAKKFQSDIVVADFDTFTLDESLPSPFLNDVEEERKAGTHTFTATVDLFNRTSIEIFFRNKHLHENDISPISFQPAYDQQHWNKVPEDMPFNVLTHPHVLRVSPVPWRKLYRRNFLEVFALRFPEGDYLYEDNTFHWLTLSHAARVSKVNRVLFHHRRNRKGQTSQGFSANGGGGNEIDSQLDRTSQWWNDYSQSAKLSGYIPNLHRIGKGLFQGFQYQGLSRCAKAAVNDVAKVYFNWLKASHWIVGMQKSEEMKSKFKRLLNRTERHWYETIRQGGWEAADDMHVGSVPSISSFRRLGWSNANDMDLSLILPTKNVADLLPHLLENMYESLTRSGITFEVFAVDDGSTDRTTDILHEFAGAHASNFYLLNAASSAQSGAGRARNRALSLVEGKYVYFADTDDTFDFAALAGAVKFASKRNIDMIVLPYQTEFIKPGGSEVEGMMGGDKRIWNRMRSWFRPSAYSHKQRKLEALGLVNYPWKQLTSSELLRDADVFFGPTLIQNDVQFHWTSIAAANTVHFYDRIVCTHRKFDASLRQQLTKYEGPNRLGMLDATGMTQRALASQGAFNGSEGTETLELWHKFFKSLSHWAQSRVPKELLPQFQYRRDRTIQAIKELKPTALQTWPYWKPGEWGQLRDASIISSS